MPLFLLPPLSPSSSSNGLHCTKLKSQIQRFQHNCSQYVALAKTHPSALEARALQDNLAALRHESIALVSRAQTLPCSNFEVLTSGWFTLSHRQLGAMSIGGKWADKGMGSMDKESSFKLLDRFYELGGNFIDTANS